MLKELAHAFTEKIPFTQSWKFKVLKLEYDTVLISFPMQDCLIGNFLTNRLHGGVAATALDTAGGLLTISNTFCKLGEQSRDVYLKHLGKTATIDIRIDYINPGLGTEFFVSAIILRSGKKIVTTRMELHNQDEVLIAAGIAAYSVG